MQSLWLAIAATLALVGSVWQIALAFFADTRAMSAFLGAHNAILREEQARIRREVPAWHFLRRRRLTRAAERETLDTLSPEELQLSKRFDNNSWGWTFVVVGTLIAFVVAWVQAIADIVGYLSSRI